MSAQVLTAAIQITHVSSSYVSSISAGATCLRDLSRRSSSVSFEAASPNDPILSSCLLFVGPREVVAVCVPCIL